MLSPNNAVAVKYRKYLAGAFFGTLVPLVYFFIQHKVHKVAGGRLLVSQASTFANTCHSLHYLCLLRVGSDFV